MEKTRKVIVLDRRKPERHPHRAGVIMLSVFSLACLLYCLAIFFFMGYGSKFFLIWGVLAAFLAVLAWLLAHPAVRRRIPKFFRVSFVVLCLTGIVIFVGVEAMIFSGFRTIPAPGADYVIVLGAQWKPSGPSYMLQKRLDAAASYLKDNPDTMVIVSGGQGSNEPISEAEGMKGYLVSAGIAEERILMEDTSTSTNENLINSGKLLDKTEDRVVLVTNNYHVFRACGIASRQGYVHLEGLAAGSYPGMLPNNLLREFFAVVKDTLVGNM